MKKYAIILLAAISTGYSSTAKDPAKDKPAAENSAQVSEITPEKLAEIGKVMEWPQEEKNIMPIIVLDSLLMNKTFDFITRRSVDLFGKDPKVTQYSDRRNLRRIYPAEYYRSMSRASTDDPIAMVVARTDRGWVVVWNERQHGCGGEPGYTYTCEAVFRNELTVSKDGSAILTRSTAALDYKYPTVRNGYIAQIPDHDNKWLAMRDRMAK